MDFNIKNRSAVITYCDDYQIWNQIKDEIMRRLPLKNLLWNNPLPGRPPRTIPELNLNFIKYSQDIFPKAIPLYNITPFFLHLFLVNCDDSEMYKSVVRKQIQEWLNVIANKKNQEWLIVYVQGQDSKKATTRFLGVGGSVYDKIKSDFFAKKCIIVKPFGQDNNTSESWQELFDRIKEGVLSSFSQQILWFEEETRKSDSQRLLPGWNYCQYFIIKEGLSFSYELMGQYDDALLQYDELYAQFFQSMTEQGAPWFQSFGGHDKGDDCEDILNLKRKPYRDLILQNQITIFDFRIYLFGRQVSLLFRSAQPIEICRRAKIFITNFCRNLHEYDVIKKKKNKKKFF
ncbi:hypothetical protein HK099_000469 [Clydaea vesicula]|uniref:TRAPPC10/Trs130 N-terminal domain-containing protein n=1 Tax=Clydaea vesicula TaxID=447962 RepID=A0AAD5XSQ3_9FUNG|nr:hypothetical protein HK099_000469 [Clydaea vesicula]